MYIRKKNRKYENTEKERLIAKYDNLLKIGRGLFTKKTKGRLLRIPMPGREKTKTDFWYDKRNRVKTTLKDLEV